jgi:hypothetical protein
LNILYLPEGILLACYTGEMTLQGNRFVHLKNVFRAFRGSDQKTAPAFTYVFDDSGYLFVVLFRFHFYDRGNETIYPFLGS